jgi:hypothetical protein
MCPAENAGKCDLDHSPARAQFPHVTWITGVLRQVAYFSQSPQAPPSLLVDHESEAHMRKNTSFAIAATMLGLAMIFWAKSSVVASHVEVVRPAAGSSAYIVMPRSYLPIQVIEKMY